MISTQAKTIQACFRNHLAWTVVRRLREERATVMLQRAYRGWRGRQAFLVKMRQIWAAHVIQRAWRGFSGRGFFTLLKTMHVAVHQSTFYGAFNRRVDIHAIDATPARLRGGAGSPPLDRVSTIAFSSCTRLTG